MLWRALKAERSDAVHFHTVGFWDPETLVFGITECSKAPGVPMHAVLELQYDVRVDCPHCGDTLHDATYHPRLRIGGMTQEWAASLIRIVHEWPREQFIDMIRRLNARQRAFAVPCYIYLELYHRYLTTLTVGSEAHLLFAAASPVQRAATLAAYERLVVLEDGRDRPTTDMSLSRIVGSIKIMGLTHDVATRATSAVPTNV